MKDIVHDLKLKEIGILDLTHCVKSLFFGEKLECENPGSKEIVNQSTKEIDGTLHRLMGFPNLS